MFHEEQRMNHLFLWFKCFTGSSIHLTQHLNKREKEENIQYQYSHTVLLLSCPHIHKMEFHWRAVVSITNQAKTHCSLKQKTSIDKSLIIKKGEDGNTKKVTTLEQSKDSKRGRKSFY